MRGVLFGTALERGLPAGLHGLGQNSEVGVSFVRAQQHDGQQGPGLGQLWSVAGRLAGGCYCAVEAARVVRAGVLAQQGARQGQLGVGGSLGRSPGYRDSALSPGDRLAVQRDICVGFACQAGCLCEVGQVCRQVGGLCACRPDGCLRRVHGFGQVAAVPSDVVQADEFGHSG
ncbi:hypothetical protein DN051_02215 [Streptomyces cadmiisoli]|uniref:Uncharacterized protein n=1 Tax=Streptomyces cadmiisoli TaxID=2184053 RepID=A0A2Z4IRK7_9ACTN|nr:hypothetical protein DN051_02215 [Streptomyces cadmiisoli]